MGKWYKEIDRKFSWSFFGFLIGILGVAFGLYSILNKEKPNIQFEIVTNTDVFNVNENIGKLQILYDSENVLSIDTTIKLVTIKFTNSGNTSFRKEDFDENYLIGFKIENFIIADIPTIINFSNPYLKNRFSFIYDSTSIRINPVILDKNDFVIFKILLIGARNESVRFTSIGKVAGQKTIPIITEIKQKDKSTLWDRVSGFLIAFTGFIIIALIWLSIELIINKFSYNKKERLIKKYQKIFNIENDKQYDQIFRLYKKYGLDILFYIVDLSKDSTKFEKFITMDVNAKGLKYKDLKYIGIKLDSSLNLTDEFVKKSFIDELILDDVFFEKINGKGKFSTEFINKIEKLINYINI